MDETQEFDIDSMSEEELDAYISEHGLDSEPIENQPEQQVIEPEVVEPEVSTETTAEPKKGFYERHNLIKTDDKGRQWYPKFTRNNKEGEVVPIEWLGYNPVPRKGVKGFAQDTLERTYNNAAPFVGISDTVIDFVNFASADGGKYDIPKLPSYENNTSQAVRNISGLVIPSLRLRGMMMNAANKAHASKQAAPWLQKLGDRKSFQAFSRLGVDIFSGGLVDYVAEQNQKDDNFVGTLKKYWPQTFQWIPDRYATTDADSPDVKRQKNVNEGAIFGILSSIVEGVAYISKAQRSLARTSKFTPDSVNNLVKDEFADIKFSDEAVEDTVLRNVARKQRDLDDLSEYFASKGVARDKIPGLNEMWEDKETLIRTRDQDGVIGAAADQAQIANNIDSAYGRLSNIITERARLEGLELDNIFQRTLVGNLVQDLKEAGRYSKKLNSGRILTDKMIDKAGEDLAAYILNPNVNKEDLIRVFDEFNKAIDDSPVKIVGKKGINISIRQLKDQLIDMDAHKARAYLLTSEAGQISDMAEGIRLMDDPIAFQRATDSLINRLEVLMVEKELAGFEANSLITNMNAWKAAKETGDKNIMEEAAKTIVDNNKASLFEIAPKAKEYTNTLKIVAKENPEFLKPLLLASEMADGDVNSMFTLHKYVQDKLGVWRKAIRDPNPNVPSIINRAWIGNYFNSMLSAVGTPTRAALGNTTGLFGRGLASIWGAVSEGDLARARKAYIAHSVMDDTLLNANKHLKLVFKKAATNPVESSFITRGDVQIKEEKALQTLRAYAEAAEENGEYGATHLLHIFDDLNAMQMDPVLRFGTNAMTALDGFSKSVTATSQAKYLALEKLEDAGLPFTKENLQKATNEIYESFRGADGLFKNETVNSISSEIALNADSPLVNSLNTLIRETPVLRSVLTFPRTTANVIDTFKRWSPAGILANDYEMLWGKPNLGFNQFLGIGKRSEDSFSPEEIIGILRKKGRSIDGDFMEEFRRLRYEVKGKAAIGFWATALTVNAALNDRCTGNGHYDKARQRVRLRNGWKPKTCKIPGTNKVVSYEFMGPIGDWMAAVIDAVDNFDTVTTSNLEDWLPKAAWLFASAITNRSNLASLEPMQDILQGNGNAATRFTASFANNAIPFGGLRNEMGKTINPQLRILKSEFADHMRNRNAWLDEFDPNGKLPGMYSPVEGTPIGVEEDMLTRMWNLNRVIKISSAPSKEEQFLIDIEYNSSPSMRISQRGAILEPNEISMIQSLMGQQGFYKKELARIQRQADNLVYVDNNGKEIKGFVNILKSQRRGGVSSDYLNTTQYKNIYAKITKAYNRAKKKAEAALPLEMKVAIREREQAKLRSQKLNEAGDINRIKEESYLVPTR